MAEGEQLTLRCVVASKYGEVQKSTADHMKKYTYNLFIKRVSMLIEFFGSDGLTVVCCHRAVARIKELRSDNAATRREAHLGS